MYYCFIPNENNVCFWFTPKCGCTFVRKLYSYLTNSLITGQIPMHIDQNNTKQYINILFTRDPYKRIVSGFMDCYVQNKKFDCFANNLSLNSLLDNLILNEFQNVDKVHFQRQLSQHYNENIIFDKIYDVENIDYDYLSELFNRPITTQLVNVFRTISYHHVKYNKEFNDKAHLLTVEELQSMSEYPSRDSFLNNTIKSKIYKWMIKMI